MGERGEDISCFVLLQGGRGEHKILYKFYNTVRQVI